MFLVTPARRTADIIMLAAEVGERFKLTQLQGISITVGRDEILYVQMQPN